MATKKTVTPETENNEDLWPVAEETPAVDPGEELVTVQLFKDNARYNEDLYVAVNGERILIQRGVPVQVKRKFAEVIEHSMTQDGMAENMMRMLSESYDRATAEKTKPY